MVHEFLPLSRHRLVSTRRTDEASDILSRCLIPVKIVHVGAPRRFRLDMNGCRVGRLFVGFNRFEEVTELARFRTDDSVCIALGCQGGHASYFQLDDEWVSVSAINAAVVSPTRRLRIRRAANANELVVRTSASVLAERFTEITGRPPPGPIVFEGSADLSKDSGKLLLESILALAAGLDHEEAGKRSSLAESLLEDVVISLILNLSSISTQQIVEGSHGDLAPSTVRRAEEYMAAHTTAPISVSDVVAVCGCSRSALHAAFKSSRGYTPMQFLAERRLEIARQRLMREPQVTLTQIALDCGFSNHGRFAKAYYRRFGETPSRTRSRNHD